MFFVAACLMASGCSSGPKLHPVRGRVSVGSTPAEGALIVFHPKGDSTPQAIRPSAVVNADGSFELSSGALGKGAPVGDYDVTVIWEPKSPTAQGGKLKDLGGGADGESKVSGDKLGGRYAKPGASGLSAKVEAKDNELLAFELK